MTSLPFSYLPVPLTHSLSQHIPITAALKEMDTQPGADDINMDNFSDTGQHIDIDIDFDTTDTNNGNEDQDMDRAQTEEINDDEMQDDIDFDIEQNEHQDEVLLDVEPGEQLEDDLDLTDSKPMDAPVDNIETRSQDGLSLNEQEFTEETSVLLAEESDRLRENDNLGSATYIEEGPQANTHPEVVSTLQSQNSDSRNESENEKLNAISDTIRGSTEPRQASADSPKNPPPNSSRPENILNSDKESLLKDESGSEHDDNSKIHNQVENKSHVEDNETFEGSSDKTKSSSRQYFPILLCCAEGEFKMFAEPGEENVPDTCLLDDKSLMEKPLQDLFHALRDEFQEGSDGNIEFSLEAPDLGLTILEDSPHASEGGCTLNKFLDLYISLNYNEGNANPEPFRLVLNMSQNFYARYMYLWSAVKEGKTLTEIQPTQNPDGEHEEQFDETDEDEHEKSAEDEVYNGEYEEEGEETVEYHNEDENNSSYGEEHGDVAEAEEGVAARPFADEHDKGGHESAQAGTIVYKDRTSSQSKLAVEHVEAKDFGAISSEAKTDPTASTATKSNPVADAAGLSNDFDEGDETASSMHEKSGPAYKEGNNAEHNEEENDSVDYSAEYGGDNDTLASHGEASGHELTKEDAGDDHQSEAHFTDPIDTDPNNKKMTEAHSSNEAIESQAAQHSESHGGLEAAHPVAIGKVSGLGEHRATEAEDDLIDWSDDELEPSASAENVTEDEASKDATARTEPALTRDLENGPGKPNGSNNDKSDVQVEARPRRSNPSTPAKAKSNAKRVHEEYEEDLIDYSDFDEETPSKRAKSSAKP